MKGNDYFMQIGEDFLLDTRSRLQSIQPAADVRIGDEPADNNFGELFRTIFAASSEALDEASAVSREMTTQLLTGQLEDLSAFMVEGQKPGILFELNLNIRNKVLDAYSEVMRMQV